MGDLETSSDWNRKVIVTLQVENSVQKSNIANFCLLKSEHLKNKLIIHYFPRGDKIHMHVQY